MSRAARASVLLPLVTTALPFVAGAVPFLHGALAGLIAIAGPFVVDAVCSFGGELRYRPGERPPPLPRRWYDLLFWVYALGFLGFFARFALVCGSLPLADAVGQGFSWIVLSGIPSLIVGHAFIHGRRRAERIAGQAIFSLLNYPDFPFLHIEGHHRHVATRADVHSAPRGQTFYGFFARYLVGELRSLPRARRRGRIVALTAIQIAWLVAIGLRGGARGLGVFLAVTFLARGIVALVNYVQHYGLERRDGERAGLEHAWDLPFKSGNWLYFNAGFHVEHHIKASVDPADLAFRSTRFVLPYNIQIILPLALVPALFFRTIHPILDAQVAERARAPRPARRPARPAALDPVAITTMMSPSSCSIASAPPSIAP